MNCLRSPAADERVFGELAADDVVYRGSLAREQVRGRDAELPASRAHLAGRY